MSPLIAVLRINLVAITEALFVDGIAKYRHLPHHKNRHQART
jgi:hypothetical protein